MQHHTNSTLTKMWKAFSRKTYRDAYVSASIANTVSAQIFTLRDKLGLSQKQLAAKTGMKQSRISALENLDDENISIETLKRLASVFDVALAVRFIPFSELAHWVQNLSPDKIAVKCFNEDNVVIGSSMPELQVNVEMDLPNTAENISYRETNHAQIRAC